MVLIAKKFGQNEEEIFILYGGAEISVILNTHPLFFVLTVKTGLVLQRKLQGW